MDFNKNIDFMMEKSPNITKKVTERSISHLDWSVIVFLLASPDFEFLLSCL